MESSSKEQDQRMDGFREGLKRAGVKLTHQRIEIFQELAKSIEHPDAETIFRAVRERLPTISLDTVYRTLWMLLDLGLIATLGSSRERTRFDANMSTHHHFVCSLCGMTRDFYSDELDNLKVPQSAKECGQVQTTHVEVRGLCLECLGKEESKATKSKRKETN
ncbi:Fur family transcriptional regulator [Thermodesulfobacteriota bacterium]